MVSINNLNKSYAGIEVLKNVNLELTNGIYGFIGNNGAGKSTLFRCMAGMENFEGNILFGSQCSIGYLPDTPFFYPYITGYEYIEFCLSASRKKVTRQDIDENNRAFRLPLDKYATRYSLGMQKRLALLALFMRNCNVYILDEPFNGLDLQGCLALKRWLVEQKETEKTIIISSHIISLLTDVCDDIYLIDGGMVATSFHNESYDIIEQKLIRQFSTL